MKNYIIVNQDNGVFVGCMWGCFFWSNLDAVYQISVPSYKDIEEVESVLNRNGNMFNNCRYIEVEVEEDGTATKEECFKAFSELVWVD